MDICSGPFSAETITLLQLLIERETLGADFLGSSPDESFFLKIGLR
jgi:hypothetical protein